MSETRGQITVEEIRAELGAFENNDIPRYKSGDLRKV